MLQFLQLGRRSVLLKDTLSAIFQLLDVPYPFCFLPCALCLKAKHVKGSRTYEGWEHLPNDDVTLQVKYGDGNHNNDDKVIDELNV